jgi:hypothetical protein
MSAFPARGQWGIVNQQTFDVGSLPAKWQAFSGHFDGAPGQHHYSFREPSMLAFPGSWMEYRNAVHSNGAGGSYHTIADAGANDSYPETYDASTHSYFEGYDVGSHPWGFQWCARFNGGPGFDTAFVFVPTNGAWPPEIDFIEHLASFGNEVTLHIHWKATFYNDHHSCDPSYPTTNSENCHANFPSIRVTVGRWTTYAVTWSAGEIDVWIDGRPIRPLTVTPTICTRRADRAHDLGDPGVEHLCMPDGYVNNAKGAGLEPFVWDMQVTSYGTTTYAGDQTDLAWIQALAPRSRPGALTTAGTSPPGTL